jgi:hypothetical protein
MDQLESAASKDVRKISTVLPGYDLLGQLDNCKWLVPRAQRAPGTSFCGRSGTNEDSALSTPFFIVLER